MLNQVLCVGRLIEYNDRYMYITIPDVIDENKRIEVPVDIINMSDRIREHCKPGDLIGVKGHLVNDLGLKVKADKITLLSYSEEPMKGGDELG